LTDGIFFDTDCLCAFLWVKEENILAGLYPGRIVLPAQVYEELKYVPHLLAQADRMLACGEISTAGMEAGSVEFRDYLKMTTAGEGTVRVIGKGEAAAIAMAKERGGTLASNNLRDVSWYARKYRLSLITTGDILEEALRRQMITEAEGDCLWQKMIAKRRKLPTGSFSEYLALPKQGR